MAETLAAVYDALLMDHIRAARNYGLADDGPAAIEIANPLCGDVLRLQLAWQGDRLAQVRFACECCGIAMGSASLMSEALAGRTIPQLHALAAAAQGRLAAASSGGGLPMAGPEGMPEATWQLLGEIARQLPARRTCASLGWQALQAALAGEANAIAREMRA